MVYLPCGYMTDILYHIGTPSQMAGYSEPTSFNGLVASTVHCGQAIFLPNLLLRNVQDMSPLSYALGIKGERKTTGCGARHVGLRGEFMRRSI